MYIMFKVYHHGTYDYYQVKQLKCWIYDYYIVGGCYVAKMVKTRKATAETTTSTKNKEKQ